MVASEYTMSKAILLVALAAAASFAQAQPKAGVLLETGRLESETSLIKARSARLRAEREFEREQGAGRLDLPRVVAVMGVGSSLRADVRYGDGRRRTVAVGDAIASRVTISEITAEEVVVLVPGQPGGRTGRFMLEFISPQMLPGNFQPGQTLPLPLPLAPVPEPLPLPAANARVQAPSALKQ